MTNTNRREFLADVGKGMLVASIGSGLAAELGLAPAFAADAPDRLLFGDREPLVGMMEDTPADKLVPILVDKLNGGTSVDELVAAGALANARTFGGLHYEGHHCFAALLPSLQMVRELPPAPRPAGSQGAAPQHHLYARNGGQQERSTSSRHGGEAPQRPVQRRRAPRYVS